MDSCGWNRFYTRWDFRQFDEFFQKVQFMLHSKFDSMLNQRDTKIERGLYDVIRRIF